MRSNNLTGTGLVDKYIGTSYDVVRKVYERLDLIELVANQIEIQKGEQGVQGDTIYVANEYSADQVTWHTDLRVTDLYRRVATVTNGVYGSWSPAVNIQGLRGDTVFIEYQYSSDNINFHFGLEATDYYRRERTVTITPTVTLYGDFSTGVLIRIDGTSPVKGVDYVDGKENYTSFIYKSSVAQPAIPIGGTYDGTTEDIPETWSSTPTTPSTGWFIWVSTRTYSTDAEGNWVFGVWSSPVKFSGEEGYTPTKGIDYFDGASGTLSSFIFTNAVSIPPPPTGGSFDGVTEIIPAAWTDDPSSPAEGESIWVSKRIYTFNGSIWVGSSWGNPSLFSYHPALGIDYFNGAAGTFTSFVYANAPVQPPSPSGGSFDGNTEVIPDGWTDDPVAPLASDYVWVSRRIYADSAGNWVGGNWSSPIQFTGTDGKTPAKGVDYFDGVSGSFISFIFKNAVGQPVTPVGGSFDGANEVFPINWTDDPTVTTGVEITWVSKGRYSYVGNSWVNAGWTTPVKYIDTTQAVDTQPIIDGVVIEMQSQFDELLNTADDISSIAFNAKETVTDLINNIWETVNVSNTVTFKDHERKTEIYQITQEVATSTAEISRIEEVAASSTAAMAKTVEELTASVANNYATMTYTAQAVATETEARATAISQMTATVDANTAEILSMGQVFTTATEANATAITQLSTNVQNNYATITYTDQAVSDEASARATAITLLEAETASTYATSVYVDQVVTDEASARATAVSALQVQTANTYATITDVSQVSSAADGNATAITALQGAVNHPTTGLGATYAIAGQAEAVSDENYSSILGMRTAISGTTNKAQTELILSTNMDAVTNEVIGKAMLGVTVDGVFTGMSVVGGSSYSGIEFKTDSFMLSDGTGTPQLYWSAANGKWQFNGGGSFSGDISAATGTFTGTVQIGGTSLNATNTLNENTTKTDVGLGNVDNDSTATIRATAAATSGTVAGWNIDSTTIYSGVSKAIDGAGFKSTAGILLESGGAIRSKEFKVETDGSAHFKGDITGATGTFSGAIIAGVGSVIDGLYVGELTIGTSKITDGAVTADTVFTLSSFSVAAYGSGFRNSATISGLAIGSAATVTVNMVIAATRTSGGGGADSITITTSIHNGTGYVGVKGITVGLPNDMNSTHFIPVIIQEYIPAGTNIYARVYASSAGESWQVEGWGAISSAKK